MIHPPQKIVGLKLCWFGVSVVRWGQVQNFRPLGLFFLVELEFEWRNEDAEEGFNCVEQKSCQSQLQVELGCVVVDNYGRCNFSPCALKHEESIPRSYEESHHRKSNEILSNEQTNNIQTSKQDKCDKCEFTYSNQFDLLIHKSANHPTHILSSQPEAVTGPLH